VAILHHACVTAVDPLPPGAWALEKIEHARQIAAALSADIDGWRTSSPVELRASIADDRLSFEVRVGEFRQPPLTGWALLAGDAFHNLRSALDALVWSFASADVLTDGQARGVCFPICHSADEWERRWPVALRSVPPDVVERIRDWQVFLRPDFERSADPLPLLTYLDVQDKHRLSVFPQVTVAELGFEHAVEFASDEAAARNAPPDVTVHEPKLESGNILISGTTLDPIKKLSGSWSVNVRLDIDTADGPRPVLELIHVIAVYLEILVWKITEDPRGAPFSY
jgi:hypothetical protein